MGKQEQLIEFCIQDIVEYISNDQNIPYDEAMRFFYNSETFSKLTDAQCIRVNLKMGNWFKLRSRQYLYT